MKTYTYTGTNTTGVTLEANGEPLEAMLFPGQTARLPENDPWVRRMVKRGYLVPLEPSGEMKAARKANVSPETASTPETKEAS